MKQIYLHWVIVLCGLWLAGAAAGAPLKRSDIPADVIGVVHLDCDTLHQTYLGKYLIYQMNRPEFNSRMLAFQSLLSFDLRTQLHGLTVYNLPGSATNAIFLFYADLDPEKMVRTLSGAQKVTLLTNRTHVVYKWMDKREHRLKFLSAETGRCVVGVTESDMTVALDVLDKKQMSFEGANRWPELGTEKEGVFLQGCANKLDLANASPALGLIRSAKQFRIRASERNNQFHGSISVAAADEATAQQMAFGLQGLLALYNLQQDNPAVSKIVSALSVTQTNARVSLTLSCPSMQLINVIKSETAPEKSAP